MGAITDHAQLLTVAQMAEQIKAANSAEPTQAMRLAASETTYIANMPGRVTDNGGSGASPSYKGDVFNLTGATVTTEWNKEVVPGLTTAQANENRNSNNGPYQTDFLRLHEQTKARDLNEAHAAAYPTHDAPHAIGRLVASYEPPDGAHLLRYYNVEMGNMAGAYAVGGEVANPQTDLQLAKAPNAIADVLTQPGESIVRSFIANSPVNAVQYIIRRATSVFKPRP